MAQIKQPRVSGLMFSLSKSPSSSGNPSVHLAAFLITVIFTARPLLNCGLDWNKKQGKFN